MGAVAVPASLAMAELAGVPVVFGLYGALLPLAVYGLLGRKSPPGSRRWLSDEEIAAGVAADVRRSVLIPLSEVERLEAEAA